MVTLGKRGTSLVCQVHTSHRIQPCAMLSLAVVLPGYHHDYTVYTETLYDKLEGAYLYDVFFLPEPLLKNTPFNDWSLVCQARLL